MIRLPEVNSFKINVKLKDGTMFSGKDTIYKPFGESEKLISFWIDDVIRIYPMEQVNYIELIPEEEK